MGLQNGKRGLARCKLSPSETICMEIAQNAILNSREDREWNHMIVAFPSGVLNIDFSRCTVLPAENTKGV
jgi:hypothetical protein